MSLVGAASQPSFHAHALPQVARKRRVAHALRVTPRLPSCPWETTPCYAPTKLRTTRLKWTVSSPFLSWQLNKAVVQGIIHGLITCRSNTVVFRRLLTAGNAEDFVVIGGVTCLEREGEDAFVVGAAHREKQSSEA